MSGRRVELTVRDRGPGVPDYALDRVFEKFYSLRRPDSGRKSTGLGLAFVREIAHLHGGEAFLANHPEGGATATLSCRRRWRTLDDAASLRPDTAARAYP